jgi:superfamily I DNA and/or RNA helicase
MVVIDEASQCDIASALPMIYRAKSAVIIGDPLQLPHITSVQEHEQDFVIDQLGLSHSKYNYVSNSLFNHSEWLSNRSGMESQFLDEHYRCHPDIVNFSNHYFYKLKAGQELTIRTKAEDFKFGVPGLHWVDVIGQSQKRNENTAEVAKCIQLATKLAQQFPDASIGIVTPFKHQKQALQSALNQLPNRESIVCDTVHQFQGDEKDIMILSLVVTEESRDSLSNFINIYSPFILNVAITRARSAMYIVGNKDYCKRLRNAHVNSLLSNLASYSEQFMN